jgi:hypothetical protein
MISEQEKQKIKYEEIYRKEIQKELSQHASSNINRVLGFLDTQHGLFIASVVVVPIMIWFLSYVQAAYKKHSEEQRQIARIDNEMIYRISNFENRLKGGDVIGFIADIDRHYAYPEFAGMRTQGLLLQLENVICEEKRPEITSARKALISKDQQAIQASLNIRGWRN